MAILKGTCDAMTIVPDSGGWSVCEARLGKAGVDFFKDTMHMGQAFFKSLVNLLFVEFTGLDKKSVRYCADMIVSGHTYFAVLFSLSSYKMLRYATASKILRPIRRIVGFVCVACIVTQVTLVSLAK